MNSSNIIIIIIFRTIKDNNENHDNLENIIHLKRKIEFITQYLKPHISKILYEVLQINQDHIKIICDYIVAEQNEINIKESTK